MQAFLAKATEKTSEYSAIFKHLSVEETKTFETFDETERLENQLTVLSDLIIYESETDKSNLGEFRNIREVDGKVIKDSNKRTTKLFAKIADAESFEDELKKLNKEGSRYDIGMNIYGLTSSQPIPLNLDLLSSFKFEEIGREIIEGNVAIAVKFQQITVNSELELNIDTPDILEATNKFCRGIIWLDLKNHQILKLLVEITFDSPKFTEPFVVMKQEYFYRPSDFNIYLPRKIVTENFRVRLNFSV